VENFLPNGQILCIGQKVFCITREFGVLGGKFSAQYAKNNNWAENFPLNHKFAVSWFSETV